MSRTGLSGGALFLAFIGALVVLLGVGAGYWYAAHQLAWWTFALAFAGFEVAWQFVKALISEVRK